MTGLDPRPTHFDPEPTLKGLKLLPGSSRSATNRKLSARWTVGHDGGRRGDVALADNLAHLARELTNILATCRIVILDDKVERLDELSEVRPRKRHRLHR